MLYAKRRTQNEERETQNVKRNVTGVFAPRRYEGRSGVAIRKIKLLLPIVILLTVFSGCAEKQQQAPVSETRILLDTFCTITIYGPHDRQLFDDAFSLCEKYEALLSKSAEGSDIWRINHAGGSPVMVAAETIEVISSGLAFGGLSDGMFDITVGRLTTLWDFSGDPGVPTITELADALVTVGYGNVIVSGDTVRLADPDTWLDLGAIAKGYIADRMADFLRERGVTGAVVDLGGDVAAVGGKPDGSPWMIGVRQPFGGQNDLLGVVETAEAAIVTSGTYERQFTENNVLYHHILDPYNGMPVVSDVVGATVLAKRAMVGDALSTVALLVGSGNAEDLLAGVPGFIGALLVLDNGDLLQLGSIDFHN